MQKSNWEIWFEKAELPFILNGFIRAALRGVEFLHSNWLLSEYDALSFEPFGAE